MKLYKVMFRWLFVMLVVMQIAVQAFLTHTHTTASGIIVHSHPFKQKHHTHSSNDLIFIHKLNQIVITHDIIPHFYTACKEFNLIEFLIVGEESFPHIELLNNSSLRAPPLV